MCIATSSSLGIVMFLLESRDFTAANPCNVPGDWKTTTYKATAALNMIASLKSFCFTQLFQSFHNAI